MGRQRLRDLATVRERQHSGAVFAWPHLHGTAQVGHVAAVHLDEAVLAPAAGQLRHPPAHQEALLVADHAHVVAVGLQEQDRVARDQSGAPPQGGERHHVVGSSGYRPPGFTHAASRLLLTGFIR